MNDFPNVLENLLKQNKLSLRELSAQVNISSSQLSKYVNGRYEPSLDNALKLAKHFSCSLDYLFGLDDVLRNAFSFNEPNFELFLDRFEKLILFRKTNINRIAKHTYLNRNTLYYWKKSKQFPKMGILVKLAKEFNVPIEYLVGRIDLGWIK